MYCFSYLVGRFERYECGIKDISWRLFYENLNEGGIREISESDLRIIYIKKWQYLIADWILVIRERRILGIYIWWLSGWWWQKVREKEHGRTHPLFFLPNRSSKDIDNLHFLKCTINFKDPTHSFFNLILMRILWNWKGNIVHNF